MIEERLRRDGEEKDRLIRDVQECPRKQKSGTRAKRPRLPRNGGEAMPCERLENAEFVDLAAKVVVLLEKVSTLLQDLTAPVGLLERSKLKEAQQELEPLQSHVLKEVRRRGLHDDLVLALANARKQGS